MLRSLIGALASVLVLACAPPQNAADAELKQAISGTWRLEYKTPSEQLVRSTVTLGADGNYVEIENVGDEQTRYSGPWYVTDGLLKLNGQKINGQGVGVGAMSFATCKLDAVMSGSFACRDDVAKKTYNYVRAKAS
jgi:hypothetical protein